MNLKKLSVVLLIACSMMFFCYGSASAMSQAEILQKIKDIKAKLTQLYAQLEQVRGYKVEWCYGFSKDLLPGTRGNDVDALQTALKKEGFTITGEEDLIAEVGTMTSAAVAGFQKKYEAEILTYSDAVPVSGQFSDGTRKLMNQMYGCASHSSNYIRITAPAGNEWVEAGANYPITWESHGNAEKLDIVLLKGTKTGWIYDVIARGVPAKDGHYNWFVPEGAASEEYGYTIWMGISGPSGNQGNWGDILTHMAAPWGQASQFQIHPKSDMNRVEMSFYGGNRLEQGKDNHVRWCIGPTIFKTAKYASVYLTKNGIKYALLEKTADLDRFCPMSKNYFKWNVKSPIGIGYRLLVELSDPNGKLLSSDESNEFAIIAGIADTSGKTIQITSPKGGEVWRADETHRITWSSTNISKVWISVSNNSMTDSSGSVNYIDPDFKAVDAAPGYYEWTIKDNWLPKGYRDKYRISVTEIVEDGKANGKSSRSDYMTILPE